MGVFSSGMAPEDFVADLAERRKLWRRVSGGSHPAAARRRVNDLVRSHIAWFKRVRGIAALPALARPAEAGEAWRKPEDPGSVKIVIVPPAADAAAEGRPMPARRRLRRKFHDLATDDAPVRVELVTSRPRRRSSLPALGTTRTAEGKAVRALFLEALGAAIVPGLTGRQVKALEEAGAVVMDNSIIAIDDPLPAAALGDFSAADVPHPWHQDFIGMDHARRKGLSGKGVLIGIVDTGIDARHPEFAGKTVLFQSFGPSGTPRRLKHAKDYGTHGTHVAALCAGATRGIARDADLAVAAVLNHRRADGRLVGFHAQILAGLNWLAQVRREGSDAKAVDIINASLGGADQIGYHSLVFGHRIDGALIVAAVGNAGGSGIGHHSAPGMFDCVVSVGAVDASGAVAGFSSWGPTRGIAGDLETFKPDLMAPGVEIVSAVPGRRYTAMNGTSMACPIVSGAAALLIEQQPALRRNPDALTERLLSLVAALPQSPDPQRCGKGSVHLGDI